MPARRSAYPVPPDLPRTFDPAPPNLASGDGWDGVEASVDTTVDEHVADADLRECVWTDGQLTGRTFTGLRAQDVRFTGCDLAGASLQDAALTRVVFESCRMTGASLAGARLEEVRFVDCVLDLADLRMASLRRTAMENSQLREADLFGATLRDVRITGCDLSRAVVDTVTVDGLDLRGSTLEQVTGAVSLAGATIGADQVIPLGAALLGQLGFVIDAGDA